jgi:hypothetical protein
MADGLRYEAFPWIRIRLQVCKDPPGPAGWHYAVHDARAARRLGFTDLDALYEAVGLEQVSVPGFLADLGIAVSPG